MTQKPDLDNFLRYDKMVENALRSVVRQAIEEVMVHGLVDEHHFYITFLTDHPGVEIPDYLKDRYPGEMTIVLQYQFYDLDVDDEKMQVTLSFNNVPERLVVPLAAISIFADPSVNFALQFQPIPEDDEDFALADIAEGDFGDQDVDGEEEGKKPKSKGGKKAGSNKTGEVISLDQFRKKDK